MDCRVLVVSHSVAGSVHQLAIAVGAGARQAGAEVRPRRVAAGPAASSAHGCLVSIGDVAWADAIAFGSPTYFGNISAALLRFLAGCADLATSGVLAGKAVTGFTAASSPNGGQEAALLSLYRTVFSWGCLIVPTGYTDASFREVGGNPYGLSVTCGFDRPVGEPARVAARALGSRLATLTTRLTAGTAAPGELLPV